VVRESTGRDLDRVGRSWEFFHGRSLRELCAFTYAEVAAGKEENDLFRLDHWLGIGPDPDEQEKRERVKLLSAYGEVQRE